MTFIVGGGAWTTAMIVKIKLFSRKPELHWSALVWFLSACIADVLITGVLVLTLVSCTRRRINELLPHLFLHAM